MTRAFTILFLLTATAFAQVGLRSTGWTAALLKPGGSICATSDTTNAWDNLLEGFNAAGGMENTWTQVGTTANLYTNADSSALSTYKPAGACDKALKVVCPTDGTETYIYYDSGSIDLETIQTDAYFSFYVETAPDSPENYPIWCYRSTTTPTSTQGINLQNNAGQLRLYWGGTGGAFINISAGQWYSVKISFDTAAAADGCILTVWSDGTVIATDPFTRVVNDPRYWFIGMPADVGVGDSGTVWFDLVTIKTN